MGEQAAFDDPLYATGSVEDSSSGIPPRVQLSVTKSGRTPESSSDDGQANGTKSKAEQPVCDGILEVVQSTNGPPASNGQLSPPNGQLDLPTGDLCVYDGLLNVIHREKGSSSSEEEYLNCGITEGQLLQYHMVLSALRSIKTMHDAVNHPCQNLMWDYDKKKCVPGRIWHPRMPTDLRNHVCRDFNQSELQEASRKCRMSAPSAPAGQAPRALIILGPAAAGKSYIRRKVEKMLHVDVRQFTELDGHEMRLCHSGWLDLVADPTIGFKDAWQSFQPVIRKVKQEFWNGAINGRKNLWIPWTASTLDKTLAEFEVLHRAGYAIDVIGLVVAFNEARDRALNRAHATGRFNELTKEKWENAMRAIQILSTPERSQFAIVFDNTNFMKPRTIYTRTRSLQDVSSSITAYRMELEDERIHVAKDEIRRCAPSSRRDSPEKAFTFLPTSRRSGVGLAPSFAPAIGLEKERLKPRKSPQHKKSAPPAPWYKPKNVDQEHPVTSTQPGSTMTLIGASSSSSSSSARQHPTPNHSSSSSSSESIPLPSRSPAELPHDERRKMDGFVAITNAEEVVALSMLESCGWDVDEAVLMFYDCS